MTPPSKLIEATGTLADAAFSELQTSKGEFGPNCAELVRSLVDKARRVRDIPPPPGHDGWDPQACADVAASFLFGVDGDDDVERARARRVRIYATCSSPGQLRKYLFRSIENYNADVARRTDFGARQRAVRRVVTGDPRFVVLKEARPYHYAIPEHVRNMPFSGSTRDLVHAVADVVIEPLNWDSDKRRSPIATATSIATIVFEILNHAGRPVLETTVVDVVLTHCGVVAFVEVPLDQARKWSSPDDFDEAETGIRNDTPDRQWDPPAQASRPAFEPETVESRADRLWAAYTPRQRLLLYACVDELKVREIEATLGVPRSSAGRELTAIQNSLRLALGTDGLSIAVLRDLTARSRALATGTTVDGSPSQDNMRRQP